MAKKNIVVAELTNEEKAMRDAQELLQLRSQIKEKEAQVEEVEKRLKSHYAAFGADIFGGLLTVQERNNPVRLEGADGKRLDALKAKLLKELPSMYVKEKRELDLGLLHASIESDPVVRAMMSEAGLRLTQGISLVFKGA